MAELQVDHNESLMVEGIVVNQFLSRTSLHQTLVNELVAKELPVLLTYLSRSMTMRESDQASSPLIQLEPRHTLSCNM
ncbi:hypothetical protein [Pseudomonas fluorescens]|uniref:hypothetical protein n=1 Tax=Pseudomonas fluorescens TaxID=294 RepID=UPI00068A53B6